MQEEMASESGLSSWLIVIFLVLGILIKGLFAFSVVGDHGQPTWDYRPVQDVPGESPYALYDTLPYPQHIKGAKGE